MASFWVDLLIYIDARFIVLASAGAALFLAYVGVLGSQVRSSEEVSESQSRSCRFPSPECHVLHSDHLMLFVMVGDGGAVSCDPFGQCRELGGGEWLVGRCGSLISAPRSSLRRAQLGQLVAGTASSGEGLGCRGAAAHQRPLMMLRSVKGAGSAPFFFNSGAPGRPLKRGTFASFLRT